MLNKIFKRDRLATGLLLGFAVPLTLYWGTVTLLEAQGMWVSPAFEENAQLLMIAINALLMRYFMLTRDQEQIGRGILGATFVYLLYYVWTFLM